MGPGQLSGQPPPDCFWRQASIISRNARATCTDRRADSKASSAVCRVNRSPGQCVARFVTIIRQEVRLCAQNEQVWQYGMQQLTHTIWQLLLAQNGSDLAGRIVRLWYDAKEGQRRLPGAFHRQLRIVNTRSPAFEGEILVGFRQKALSKRKPVVYISRRAHDSLPRSQPTLSEAGTGTSTSSFRPGACAAYRQQPEPG